MPVIHKIYILFLRPFARLNAVGPEAVPRLFFSDAAPFSRMSDGRPEETGRIHACPDGLGKQSIQSL